jgi:hypothetical protein
MLRSALRLFGVQATACAGQSQISRGNAVGNVLIASWNGPRDGLRDRTEQLRHSPEVRDGERSEAL